MKFSIKLSLLSLILSSALMLQGCIMAGMHVIKANNDSEESQNQSE